MVSDRARKRIERLLDQIDEAADQKDWSLVREHAKDVLALESGNPDAQEFLTAADRRISDA